MSTILLPPPSLAWDTRTDTVPPRSLRFGFALCDTDAFLFVFRGTKSDDIRNWIIDLSVLELDLDLPYPGSNGAKVHGGFYRTYATTNVRVLVLESWERLRAKYVPFSTS